MTSQVLLQKVEKEAKEKILVKYCNNENTEKCREIRREK
jgi:hypothetical protein